MKFEYYKSLRNSPTWGISDSPLWEYNVYHIDTSIEKDDESLWYEYNDFLFSLSNQGYRQFVDDAWAWWEARKSPLD